MPTNISGLNGIDTIQDGVVVPAALNTAVNPAVQRIQTFTAQASTAGTSIDFTGIPSWAKEITLVLNGVSTNGTANVQFQLGSGVIQTTGYISGFFGTAGTAVSNGSSTSGIVIRSGNTAAQTYYAAITIALVSGNTWASSFFVADVAGNNGGGGGAVTLAGVLDRLRVTTATGTDTFDAGSINIIVKG